MSLEQEPPITQPGSIENQTDRQEETILEQTPKTIKGQLAELLHAATSDDDQSRQFLLRVVQPGLAGLMDGSVSTLAPIFATAFATKAPFTAVPGRYGFRYRCRDQYGIFGSSLRRRRTYGPWQSSYTWRHYRYHDVFRGRTTHVAFPHS